MKLQILVIAIVALATVCLAADVQVKTIERPNRNPPTANTNILFDDRQVLVIDIGKTSNDADEIKDALKPLLRTRKLNGFFITHAHPDHVGTISHVKAAFPEATFYIASDAVQNEAMVLMNVFGQFLNASNPANPSGTAANKFNWGGRSSFRVATSASDLWDGDQLRLHASGVRLGETNHFGWIDVTQPSDGSVLIFSGDIIYVNTHVYLGYGLSLSARCDWLNFLFDTVSPLYARYDNVTLHPGHGPVITDNIRVPVEAHAEYIEYATSVFTSTCSPAEAQRLVLAKYPDLNDEALFTVLTLAWRVPNDAMQLGEQCANNAPVKASTRAPPCFINLR